MLPSLFTVLAPHFCRCNDYLSNRRKRGSEADIDDLSFTVVSQTGSIILIFLAQTKKSFPCLVRLPDSKQIAFIAPCFRWKIGPVLAWIMRILFQNKADRTPGLIKGSVVPFVLTLMIAPCKSLLRPLQIVTGLVPTKAGGGILKTGGRLS